MCMLEQLADIRTSVIVDPFVNNSFGRGGSCDSYLCSMHSMQVCEQQWVLKFAFFVNCLSRCWLPEDPEFWLQSGVHVAHLP